MWKVYNKAFTHFSCFGRLNSISKNCWTKVSFSFYILHGHFQVPELAKTSYPNKQPAPSVTTQPTYICSLVERDGDSWESGSQGWAASNAAPLFHQDQSSQQTECKDTGAITYQNKTEFFLLCFGCASTWQQQVLSLTWMLFEFRSQSVEGVCKHCGWKPRNPTRSFIFTSCSLKVGRHIVKKMF